jgi:hypothetical protein
MKKILVGQFERILGTVAVNAGGEWVLDPHNDATADELKQVAERVYARVQRRRKPLTRAQFVNQFFAKGGAPAAAFATSAWGKSYRPPELQALINRLCPADDPWMAEVRRRDTDLLRQVQTRQRA